jgi:uncharacterized membrane protein YdcZ (DUF606 family)
VGAAAVSVGGALAAAARSIAGLLPALAALVMDAARWAQMMPQMFQWESIAGRVFACRGVL